MDNLGCVIVTYNRLELLKECVEHALNQTVRFKKIIIINNNSTDGTAEYLSSLCNIDTLKIINLEENIGGSGGFYTGVKYVYENPDIEWVLLIDDDAIIDYNFNENIVKYYTEHILAYSGVVKVDNKIDLNHRRYLMNNRKFKENIVDLEKYAVDYFDYDIATFCGLYINTNLIRQIGLPEKDFFIWYDDTEYSLRINKETKIRNVNSAILNHKCKINNNYEFTWKEYYGRRNKLYIIKKYFSIESYYEYMIWLLMAFLKHKLKSVIKRDMKSAYKANVCMSALIDGNKTNLGKNSKFLP